MPVFQVGIPGFCKSYLRIYLTRHSLPRRSLANEGLESGGLVAGGFSAGVQQAICAQVDNVKLFVTPALHQ